MPWCRWRRVAPLLAAVGYWAYLNGLLAQELRLHVQDATGSGMAAAGSLIPTAPGVTAAARRNFRTDDRGTADLRDLAPGSYRLLLTRYGFQADPVEIAVPTTGAVEQTITMAVRAPSTQVNVVDATPLAGTETELRNVPAPVQVASAQEIAESNALNISDFLNQRLTSVFVNEIQGNPFQPDVNFRGYTASPLLGTPQGLSIYLDGVRLNQPFGDVVSWDLIPRVAISETTLMPGSNPLFGLNTLGGAVALETKSGSTHPGSVVQVSGGSFGRRLMDLEHGGANAKGLDWYVASSLFFEDGWRQSSPSDVRQFFGKLGWLHNKTALHLSVGYANNALTGNGLQEQRFLAQNYSSVYTTPDQTLNRSPMANLSVRHTPTAHLSFSGNAYVRALAANTVNGDVNQDSLDQSVYQPSTADQAALRAAGYTGFPTSGANSSNTPFPYWRCIAQVLQRADPAERCDALLTRTTTNQHNYGAFGQATWTGTPHRQRNQFTIGGGFDGSHVGFGQTTQLGYLNPDRSVTTLNAFADGVTGGTLNGDP